MSMRRLLLYCLFICSASAFVAGGKAIPTTGADPTQPGQVVRRLKRPDEIRGSSRYGSENNSTILSPEDAAAAVGVRATSPKATSKTWQRAWRFHKRMLPLLHAFDRNKPPDSSLSLAVLWWKALSGNDQSSPAFDDGL